MSRRLEELGHAETRMGLLTLRRRYDPALRQDLYEVKLDEEFLMSSAWTVAERHLAAAGLAAHDGELLRVLVGGLGLGYTAMTALEDPRVTELVVVDALEPMIAWHRARLLPEAAALIEDPRCALTGADFFRWAREADDPSPGTDLYDVVLLDVDHSPRHLLDPSHADLYTAEGLRRLARRLAPSGVFALWSDDPPDERLLDDAAAVFSRTDAEIVTFPNPLTRGESTATVYVFR